MKKVKIYTIHYNRPDFIQWQYDSLKAHLKDEYEYIVVNNAKEEIFRQHINNICSSLKINCIETHYTDELAGKHHANALNYIWQNYMSNDIDAYSLIIDCDVFLIKQFCVNSFMNDAPIAGPK